MSFLFRLLPTILVALSIFSLDFFHFRVDRSLPSGQVLDRAAVSPQDGVLKRVADISLDVSLGIPAQDRGEAAHEIHQGRLPAPAFSSQKLALRGWPADLFVGGPTFQLVMASLSVEDLLLREFESGGRREYYELAKARVLEFADWEAKQHEPAAFLWNDHAVAARISVLTRLWRHLRADPDAAAAQRAALLGLVSRSGGLLEKNSQFTVRTNHGVMQNIALLQVAAAFPDLPRADAWKKLAAERLELQLGFYVSSEGVVLEHSSEYHLFGVQLLEYAVQLARLNGMEPSGQLVSAYQRAQEFSKVLARPDGSVPLIGNTAGKAFSQESHDRFLKEGAAAPDRGAEPPVDARLYPVSGYAVWNGRGAVPSQVAVAWAKHDRHGHKHADETSVHFWSRGLDWVTATGYWPYGDTGYDDANGWRGANAPHLRGEAARSARRVELKYHGGAGQVQAVDVENARESGGVFRRQVVRLGAERLLVVDVAVRAAQSVDTLWTLRPESQLRSEGPAHFIAQPPVGDHVLHLNFAFAGEGQGAAKASAGGSFSPFAGWVVLGRRPTAAPSVEVERGGGSHMTAALFSVEDRGGPAPGLSLEPGGTSDEWRATVSTAQGPLQVSRRGALLEVSGPPGGGLAPQSVNLRTPASVEEPRRALKAAMTEALAHYPIWRELKYFHNRLYLLIATLWAALELALWLPPIRRRLQPHAGRALALNLSFALGWLLLAWWIHARYLETSAHLLGYLSGH